jgi:hypothetical protein
MATKAFTRVFSNTTVANRNFSPLIAIGANKQRCVSVQGGSEGRITDLTVNQISGTPNNFTVELLKSKIPFTPDTDVAQGTAAADDITLYRILPSQIGVAGVALQIDKDTPGFNYINLDGTPTNPQRYVYLVIIPDAGGDASTWSASISFAIEVQ